MRDPSDSDSEPFEALDLKNLIPVTESIGRNGERVVEVRSREVRAPVCCLAQKLVRNGTKTMRFRDFPLIRRAVVLKINRQRWTCRSCEATVYEEVPDLSEKRRMTRRFQVTLGWDAVQHSFADAAKINDVNVSLAKRCFQDVADEALADYRFIMPRVLGIDEKVVLGRARLVLGNIEEGCMLDMQPSRRAIDMDAYFGPMLDREKVEVVCQDMWKGYERNTRRHFPNAVTVIDKFHVVRLGDYGVSEARKSLFKDVTNEERVLLKRSIGLLKVHWPPKREADRTRLDALLKRYPRLAEAYWLKERLYEIYQAANRSEGEHRTTAWMADATERFPVQFKEAISAIRGWRPHILRYFEHPFTNNYVERLNGMIAEMNTRGKGYDFEVLRAKALLKHGSRTLRLADGTIPWHAMGPDDEDMEPGDAWVWTGAPLSTLEAEFRDGSLLP